MENSNAVKNPIVSGTKLSKNDGGATVDSTMFKQLVGSLLYLIATRPDIMYAVSLISRFMSCPSESHWLAAKCILRYLKGTTKLGTDVVAYSDSDFVGDLDDRRGTSRYVFFFGFGAVSWASKKQPIVRLSTTETEYIVVAFCVCQCVWIKRVLEKLDPKE